MTTALIPAERALIGWNHDAGFGRVADVVVTVVVRR